MTGYIPAGDAGYARQRDRMPPGARMFFELSKEEPK
jgi:hypothetical protein